MAEFGLLPSGFSIKRLTDIKTEIESSLRTIFGVGINLLPTELLGQIVGIISEREALVWELAQAVYNSQYPDTASGVALDNVVAITGIKRLEATKGNGSGIATGTLGTVIPAGSVVSVNGNPVARFITTIANTIAAGTDEVQLIQFSSVPDAGTWTLIFDGDETGSLTNLSTAVDIQTALNALTNLSGVTVSGNFAAGFAATFAGDDGQQNQPLLQVGTNTLTLLGLQVSLNFSATTEGVLPNVACDLEAESTGVVTAPAESLTVIESPVSGWDSFRNPLDINPGTEIETDAELRLRRNETLATAGAGTVEAIRSRMLEIDEVTDARVFHNTSNVFDFAGRPPHSIQVVLVGGDEDEIAQQIWLVAPAGIQLVGDIVKIITDTQGFSQTIKFDRPDEIEIWVEVTLTTNADFPTDGSDQVEAAIVAYADENFGIGDDVITTQLFCAIHEIAGITDIEIEIGTAPAPTSDDNIEIEEFEVSVFDSSRITITVI